MWFYKTTHACNRMQFMGHVVNGWNKKYTEVSHLRTITGRHLETQPVNEKTGQITPLDRAQKICTLLQYYIAAGHCPLVKILNRKQHFKNWLHFYPVDEMWRGTYSDESQRKTFFFFQIPFHWLWTQFIPVISISTISMIRHITVVARNAIHKMNC